jgi:hypothetical protein
VVQDTAVIVLVPVIGFVGILGASWGIVGHRGASVAACPVLGGPLSGVATTIHDRLTRVASPIEVVVVVVVVDFARVADIDSSAFAVLAELAEDIECWHRHRRGGDRFGLRITQRQRRCRDSVEDTVCRCHRW